MSPTGKPLNAVCRARWDQSAYSVAARRRATGSPTKHPEGVTASFGFVDGTNNTTFNNLSCTAARADNAGGPAAQLAKLAPGGAVLQFMVTARGRTFPSTPRPRMRPSSLSLPLGRTGRPGARRRAPRLPNMAGGDGKADEDFGLPGSVERRIYRSTHLRRWLPIYQVEVWLLYLEPSLQSCLEN